MNWKTSGLIFILLFCTQSYSQTTKTLAFDSRIVGHAGYGSAKFDADDSNPPETSQTGARVMLGVLWNNKASLGLGASYSDIQQRSAYDSNVGNRSGIKLSPLQIWVGGEITPDFFFTATGDLVSSFTFSKKSTGDEIVLSAPEGYSAAISYRITPRLFGSICYESATYAERKIGDGSKGVLITKFNVTHYGLEFGLRF